MTSLSNKIMTSYGVAGITLMLFVAVVIADLRYLRTQIIGGEAVDALYVASQEIRRDEKNLFIHHHTEALERLEEHLEVARRALSEGERVFAEIAEPGELQGIDRILRQYRGVVAGYLVLPEVERPAAQEKIRATGRYFSELTRHFGLRQRGILAETTRVAVWTLLAASLTVILMGIAGAWFVVRQVVRPLAQLELQLDQVAEGEKDTLTLRSQDKEIQSFVHHFNSMLEKLRRQQHQMRHHEKVAALGVLVSGVAHELNNPLSNISTSVQLLLEDDGSTREDLRRQWLSHVDEECERARRIVRRLLDSVRQPTPRMRNLSAAALVRSAALLIHRQLPETLMHIEDITEAMIPVDRERMQQVFINLIKNAHDAGARNIWIVGYETTWQQSRPKNRDKVVGDITEIRQAERVLQYLIDDDGPGIPPEHMAKIFDPFFSTQSGGEGTGLGLYLVEEIVSEHSGCITVDHRPGGGTRFSVWLPMEPPETNVKSETL